MAEEINIETPWGVNMAMKHITDIQVLQAVRDSKSSRDTGHHIWPYELLMERTGESEKVCFRCMERAVRNGWLDYGVSVRAAWITAHGKFLLENATPTQLKTEGSENDV